MNPDTKQPKQASPANTPCAARRLGRTVVATIFAIVAINHGSAKAQGHGICSDAGRALEHAAQILSDTGAEGFNTRIDIEALVIIGELIRQRPDFGDWRSDELEVLLALTADTRDEGNDEFVRNLNVNSNALLGIMPTRCPDTPTPTLGIPL